MFPGVFSGEIKVHCWASSSTASPKFRCSIVLGFHHSPSLASDEVEDDESSGSISGPDGKPGPVGGSGDGDGGVNGGGNGGDLKGICVFTIGGFDGTGGCCVGAALSGGDSDCFGGAGASSGGGMGEPAFGSVSACITYSAI